MEHEAITNEIIGGAMKVHRVLGPGFLESVYQNALSQELRSRNLVVERGKRVAVRYEGVVVGEFSTDLLVEGVVLVENKATRSFIPAHEAQLLHYLTATGIDIGLLLNFGGERLEYRRKWRVYRSRTRGTRGRIAAS